MLIEVFSDVVCPWCYVGERRLAQALAQREGVEVEVRWRPFQLRPELPPQGIGWEAMVNEKFGGRVKAQPMFDHVAQLGAVEGITLDFDRIASSPNTLDGHRLILLAREQGKEWEMANRLFAAYFGEGYNLNDPEQLVTLAAEAGLDEAEVRAFLAGDRFADEVQESQRAAYASGIHSVPSYVINQRYLVQGAQPTEVFVQVLDQLQQEDVAPVG